VSSVPRILMSRPAPVTLINNKGVSMSEPMPRWLRAAHMRMIRRQIIMQMRKDFRVVGWPQQQGSGKAERGHHAQHNHDRAHPKLRAEPAGKRTGHKPAGVRQCELRRKQRAGPPGVRTGAADARRVSILPRSPAP